MFDLHTHSSKSDGILRPQELVSRAKNFGVSVLALTDHDTIAGLEEAARAAEQQRIRFVNGVEFSSLWKGHGIHVLGLNFCRSHPVMRAAVLQQEQTRAERAAIIADKLARVGIADALQGAQRQAGDAGIGRPHFARYLVERGVVRDVNEAFSRYLGHGRPGDVKQMWPSVSQVVEWITASGGTAVLAHPDKYRMTNARLCRLLCEFIAAGGEGIEVVSGNQEPEVTSKLAELGRRYKLLASCGSDFHQPDQRWQELGCCGTLPEGCEPVWQLWTQDQHRALAER